MITAFCIHYYNHRSRNIAPLEPWSVQGSGLVAEPRGDLPPRETIHQRDAVIVLRGSNVLRTAGAAAAVG